MIVSDESTDAHASASPAPPTAVAVPSDKTDSLERRSGTEAGGDVDGAMTARDSIGADVNNDATPSDLHAHSSSSAVSVGGEVDVSIAVDRQLLDDFDQMDAAAAALTESRRPELQSDLSSAATLELLREVRAESEYLRGFSDDDLRMMGEVFSVLRVPAGEKIISKGEPATFCGIVLQGSCAAILSPTMSVDLRAGNLVGEMALFESMSRSADIVTREESVLAVLTFQELDSLAVDGGVATTALQMKLVKMFAVASIRKLRSSGDRAAAAAAAATGGTITTRTSNDGSAPVPTAVAEKSSSQSMVASSPTASVVSPQFSGVTRESLYRVRLALEKDKDAAHRLADEERAARVRVEQRNLSVAASLDRYKNLAGRFKEALQRATDRIDVQRAEADEAQAQIARLREEMDAFRASYATRFSQQAAGLATAQSAAAEAQRLVAGAQEQARQEVRDEMEALKAENAARESDLARARDDAMSERDSSLERSSLLDDDLAATRALLTTSHAESIDLASAKRASDESLKHHMGLVSQLNLQVSSLRTALKDEQDRLTTASTWKQKAIDATAALQLEQRHAHATIAGQLATAHTLRVDVTRLRLLLKYIAVAAFVKLYRLKKSARHLHIQVSELLVNILEGHVLATSAGRRDGASQAQDEDEEASTQTLIKRGLARRKRTYLDGVVARTSGGVRPKQADLATVVGFFSPLRQQRMNAAAAAGAVVPTIKIAELLTSLEEEVSKLQRPFDEVQSRIAHWKATSECFFARNIELTSVILQHRKQIADAQMRYTTLEGVLAKHASEYEAALGTSATLRTEVARLKQDLQSYKVSTRTLEAAADVVGARKAEMARVESRIALQKAHLAYVQRRYVDTADAINAASGKTVVDAAPPKGPPHFPPATQPHTYTGSMSMSRLVDATLGVNAGGGASESPASPSSSAPGATFRLPLAHEDPELHHVASLRHLSQVQQDLALVEFEKWKRVQYALENDEQHDDNNTAAAAAGPRTGRRGRTRAANARPTDDTFDGESTYAAILDSVHSPSVPALDPSASRRRRATGGEEEAKSGVTTAAPSSRSARRHGGGGHVVGDLEVTMPPPPPSAHQKPLTAPSSMHAYTLPRLDVRRDYAFVYGVNPPPRVAGQQQHQHQHQQRRRPQRVAEPGNVNDAASTPAAAPSAPGRLDQSVPHLFAPSPPPPPGRAPMTSRTATTADTTIVDGGSQTAL